MRSWLIFILLFLLSACAAIPEEVTPVFPAMDNATATCTPQPSGGTATATVTITNAVPAVGVTATATQIQLQSGEFTFIIYSPADGALVSQPQVDLKGWASTETVLTVNHEIYLLAGQQDFKISVPLEEGPNAIEIVASDYAGNEIDIILTATYQPEE